MIVTADDAVVRVRIRCTEDQARRVDQQAIRQQLYHAGAHNVWQIAVEIVRADRARVSGIDETLSTADALAMWATANAIEERDVRALQDMTGGYLATVPR